MAYKINKQRVVRFPKVRARLLTAAISSCFIGSVQAGNLPTGGVVAAGSASFNQVGNVLNVTNSNGAVINWNTFSIGSGYTTNFIQPSVSSSVLNRVLSTDPSVILGSLTSNGRVFLINPNGILVGQGATINVGQFVASTLNISNANFLANKLQFDATPGAGSVTNNGNITTPTGGSVYLVAPNVTNNGIITTPQGETLLAAGQTVTLLDTSTPGVSVEITGAEGNATNLGTIVADAGRIGIAGVLVRNSGTLNASSVVNEGGKIFLKASQDAYVDGNGRIVTTGTKGGTVDVLGNRVAVMDDASIDASGTNGGGTVLIGGDYQGKNAAIQNSTITYFGPNATVKANATDNGNGGKVIVWADDTTRAYGSIEAKGGANGGNGGFVETSGHNYLDFNAAINIGANKGSAGTLLLDPMDLYIEAGGGGLPLAAGVGGPFGAFTNTAAYISPAALAAVNGNVNLSASRDITFVSPVALTASGAGLNASAGRNLTMDAGSSISTTGGYVTLQSGTGSLRLLGGGEGGGVPAQISSGGGAIRLASNSYVNLGYGMISSAGGAVGGNITVSGTSVYNYGSINSGNGNISITATSGPIYSPGALNFGSGSLVLSASSGISAYSLSGSGTITSTTGGYDYLYAASVGLNLGNISGNTIYVQGPGAINANNAISSTGSVTINSSGAALTLSSISGSSVNLTAAGSINATGAVTANSGYATFNAGGAIGNTAPITVNATDISITTPSTFSVVAPSVSNLALHLNAAGLGTGSSITGSASLGGLSLVSDGSTVTANASGTTLGNFTLGVTGKLNLPSFSGASNYNNIYASGDVVVTTYTGGYLTLSSSAGALTVGTVSGVTGGNFSAENDLTLSNYSGSGDLYLNSSAGAINVTTVSGIDYGDFNAWGNLTVTNYTGTGSNALSLSASTGTLTVGTVTGVSGFTATASSDVTLGSVSVSGGNATVTSYNGSINTTTVPAATTYNINTEGGAVSLTAGGNIGGDGTHQLAINGGDITLNAGTAVGSYAVPLITTSTGSLYLTAGTTFNVENWTDLSKSTPESYYGLSLNMDAGGMGTTSSIYSANFGSGSGGFFNPQSVDSTVDISSLGSGEGNIALFNGPLSLYVNNGNLSFGSLSGNYISVGSLNLGASGNLVGGDITVGSLATLGAGGYINVGNIYIGNNALSLDATGTVTTGTIHAYSVAVNQINQYATHGSVSLGYVDTYHYGGGPIAINGDGISIGGFYGGSTTLNSTQGITVTGYGASNGGYISMTAQSGSITTQGLGTSGDITLIGYSGNISTGALSADGSVTLTANNGGVTTTGGISGFTNGYASSVSIYAGNGSIVTGNISANSSVSAVSHGYTITAGEGGPVYQENQISLGNVTIASSGSFSATSDGRLTMTSLSAGGGQSIYSANINAGYVSIADLDTRNLTLSTGYGFYITSNTDFDSLNISGTAGAIGGSSLNMAGSTTERFAFGNDGSGNLNLNATSYSHPLNLSIQVSDTGINANNVFTYGGSLSLGASGTISVGYISTLGSSGGAPVSLSSSTGSILSSGVDGGYINSGNAAVTLVAGQGSVGTAASGQLQINNNGYSGYTVPLTIWAKNEVNVEVFNDASPGDISSLTLGVNGSGSGAISIVANDLPSNFLTRSGGNLVLAAVPTTMALTRLEVVGIDGNLSVAGTTGGGNALNNLTLVSAGNLTVGGDVMVGAGTLTLRAGTGESVYVDGSGNLQQSSYYNTTGDLVIQPATGTLAVQGGSVNLLAGGNVLIGNPTGAGNVTITSAPLEINAEHGNINIQGGTNGGAISFNTSGYEQRFTAYGGDILIASGTGTGGTVTLDSGAGSEIFSAGNNLTLSAQNNALSVTGASQQFSAGNNLQILGGGVGGAVSVITAGGNQSLSADNLLLLESGTDSSASLSVSATGNQILFGNDFTLMAQTGALVVSGGNQTLYQSLQASHDLSLTSGTASTGTLTITGNGSQNQFLSANNNLTATARNAALTVYGGSGLQSLEADNSLQIFGGGVGGSVMVQDNNSQTITASNGALLVRSGTDASAVVTIDGGSASQYFNAYSNTGSINFQAQAASVLAMAGSQSLYSTGAISLSGGSGANAFAHVQAANSQTVTAGSLTLAGGSGTNAKAQLSGATQSIQVSGPATLTGGSGVGASADLFGTTTSVSISGAMSLIAGNGGVGIGSVSGDGAGLVTINNGTQLIAYGPVSVTADAFNITGNGSLLGPNNLNLTVSGALNVASGSYVGAHLGADVAAGAATINGGLFADGDLSLLSSGQIAVSGGNIDAGGAMTIVAGQVMLNNGFVGGYGVGGVSIGATTVGLDNGSIVGAFAPTANVGMVISGGNLTLDHGSHILASQDVILALTGADAQIILNGAAGETPSTIETQVLHTTDITFLGRTSGGVTIDGASTTTTVYGGSGFYALGNVATIGSGLEITYVSNVSGNVAGNLIDQFFSNLTDPNKKKYGDTTVNSSQQGNGKKQDGVGQCT